MSKKYLPAILLFSGCIFSTDETETIDLINGYKVLSIYGNNSVIFQHPKAETHEVIVPDGVDSVGWDAVFIYGSVHDRYFIIEQQSRKVLSWDTPLQELDGFSKPNSRVVLKSVESL